MAGSRFYRFFGVADREDFRRERDKEAENGSVGTDAYASVSITITVKQESLTDWRPP
jgi:hypothetical protein